MTLTKRDLVSRIAEEKGQAQQHVLDIVQATFDHITKALAQGQKVELRNFGIFEVRVRKARLGRNPGAPSHSGSALESQWPRVVRAPRA
jgi:nucleoid DNA-binding protein